jgi:hypothetical protein
MVANYDHLAARQFAKALRAGDRAYALALGQKVTSDPDAVNYGVPLTGEYNDKELADLIDVNLDGINQGRWDMTSQVYLPVVIGAVCHWVTEEAQRDNDGKTGSESLEQSEASDSSGS